jgi:hypothetical protein
MESMNTKINFFKGQHLCQPTTFCLYHQNSATLSPQTNCYNLILRLLPKLSFSFKIQNKKIKKRLATWQEQDEKAFTSIEEPN